MKIYLKTNWRWIFKDICFFIDYHYFSMLSQNYNTLKCCKQTNIGDVFPLFSFQFPLDVLHMLFQNYNTISKGIDKGKSQNAGKHWTAELSRHSLQLELQVKSFLIEKYFWVPKPACHMHLVNGSTAHLLTANWLFSIKKLCDSSFNQLHLICAHFALIRHVRIYHSC